MLLLCVILLFSAFCFVSYAEEEDTDWYYTDFGLPENYERRPYEKRMKNRSDVENSFFLPNYPSDYIKSKSLTVDRNIFNPISCSPYLPDDAVMKVLTESPTALVVNVTDKRVQFTYTTDEQYTYAITLTQVEVKQVCRQNGGGNIQVGDMIWLKESYGIIEKDGSDMFFASHGSRQRPLISTSLIFLQEWETAQNSSVYTFDEFYYWALDDRVDQELLDRMVMSSTYVYNNCIQYLYYDTALSYFNLLEEETPSSAKPSTEGPNWLMVFASVAVLSGIGALAYTVNGTVKKNTSTDPK